MPMLVTLVLAGPQRARPAATRATSSVVSWNPVKLGRFAQICSRGERARVAQQRVMVHAVGAVSRAFSLRRDQLLRRLWEFVDL
jgi:hypothetical protein